MEQLRTLDDSYLMEFVGGGLGYMVGKLIGTMKSGQTVGTTTLLDPLAFAVGGGGFILVHALWSTVGSQDVATYVAMGSCLLGGYMYGSGSSLSGLVSAT